MKKDRGEEKPEIEEAPNPRKPPVPAAIVARVGEFLKADEAPCSPGVQPLNAGFFALERLRNPQGAKKRDKDRGKVRG